jgi:hypothetical protein
MDEIHDQNNAPDELDEQLDELDDANDEQLAQRLDEISLDESIHEGLG